jgi:hypothetical protein
MFGKALKIKHFSALQSHCKATAKDTTKHQSVENQALAKILCSFAVNGENMSKNPTLTPTD